MKRTITSCDVCKKERDIIPSSIQVIFTTEQTEGRGVANHLSMENLDICDSDLKFLLEGHYLFGSGAQGHNHYWFKDVNGEPK